MCGERDACSDVKVIKKSKKTQKLPMTGRIEVIYSEEEEKG